MDSTKFLTDAEREHLENLLRESIATDTRNASMLLTAIHSGARATELLGLQWTNISLDTGEVFLRTLKGGKNRSIVLPTFVREALRQWYALQRPNSDKALVFGISYPRLAEVWYLYRPARKPFKCLRHSFAMRAYARTKDIRFVQQTLGHRSLNNTTVYLDHSYSVQEFKKLMRVR